MQVYFDLEKKTLTIKSNNDIYEGSINANKLEVFVKVTDNTQQLYNSAFFSITALMSNGRKIGHFTHDGVINNTIIDGDYYNILTFTLTKENGYTLSAGILNVTLWLNVTNSNAQLVSREAVGNILINVKETTQVDDNILIVGESGETIYNFRTAIIAIQDSQNQLGLQLTDFGNRINNIEGKMIKNLGTISDYTELDNILEVGYYIFSLYMESSGTTYLNIMEVESSNYYIVQTILQIGMDGTSLTKRTYTISSKTWSTYSDSFVMMSLTQDNLNSKSPQLPLSANQGRILKELIDNLQVGSNGVIDLGTINEFPESVTNEKLNVVKTAGLYSFNYLSVYYFMLVAGPLAGFVKQYIINGNPNGGMWLYLRESSNDGTSWTVKEQTLLSDSAIVDSLESEDSAKPLSALQGKILNEKINNIEENINKIASPITNLGTILSYDDLNLVTTDGFYIYKAEFGQTNPDMCLMEVYHQQQYAIQVIYLFNHAFARLVTRQQTLVNYELVWSDVVEYSLLKSTDVIDNLYTDSSSKPLSALQGKILNEKIGDVEALLEAI